MNLKGGCIIIDCKGLNLSDSTAQEIENSFATAKTALDSGKPIIAKNCVYGNAPVSPVTCFAWAISTTEIVIVGATLHIHVKSDNTATVVDVTA